MAGYTNNYGNAPEYSDKPYADSTNGTQGANTPAARQNQNNNAAQGKGSNDPYEMFRSATFGWPASSSGPSMSAQPGNVLLDANSGGAQSPQPQQTYGKQPPSNLANILMTGSGSTSPSPQQQSGGDLHIFGPNSQSNYPTPTPQQMPPQPQQGYPSAPPQQGYPSPPSMPSSGMPASGGVPSTAIPQYNGGAAQPQSNLANILLSTSGNAPESQHSGLPSNIPPPPVMNMMMGSGLTPYTGGGGGGTVSNTMPPPPESSSLPSSANSGLPPGTTLENLKQWYAQDPQANKPSFYEWLKMNRIDASAFGLTPQGAGGAGGATSSPSPNTTSPPPSTNAGYSIGTKPQNTEDPIAAANWYRTANGPNGDFRGVTPMDVNAYRADPKGLEFTEWYDKYRRPFLPSKPPNAEDPNVAAGWYAQFQGYEGVTVNDVNAYRADPKGLDFPMWFDTYRRGASAGNQYPWQGQLPPPADTTTPPNTTGGGAGNGTVAPSSNNGLPPGTTLENLKDWYSKDPQANKPSFYEWLKKNNIDPGTFGVQPDPPPPGSGTPNTPSAPPPEAPPPTPEPPAPLPTIPNSGVQGLDVAGFTRQLYDPLFKRQQSDLARTLRAQGAFDESIKGGGFNESLGRAESQLVGQQGAQLAEHVEAGLNRAQQLVIAQIDDATKRFGIKTNADLERWLNSADSNTVQKLGIEKNDLLQRYIKELDLQGIKYSADAGIKAAELHAAAASAGAGVSMALGQKQIESNEKLAGQQNTLEWAKLQSGLYQSGQQNYVTELGYLMNSGISASDAIALLQAFGTTPPVFVQP